MRGNEPRLGIAFGCTTCLFRLSGSACTPIADIGMEAVAEAHPNAVYMTEIDDNYGSEAADEDVVLEGVTAR